MKGCRRVLLGNLMLLALLASCGALAAAQVTGTLPAGQILPQNQTLSSSDGRVYLLVQGDGNLVLYSAQVANLFGQSYASAIVATATFGATPGPFSLVMQQDCNLALLNGNSQIIFQSGTANPGTGPCQLVVSGAGGGGFAVVDSTGATLYSQGAYSPPGTVPGTLPANAVLTQDSKLFSSDGTVCLIAQSDGNVVLYNVALLVQYGSATAAAAVWDSGTFSNMMGRTNGQAHPFRLIMQSDCNLVLYDNGGTEFKDAIYYSATYGQGTPPCALTVSGAGGGFISVSDSTYTALYVQPPGFQVLLDGYLNYTYVPGEPNPRQAYQVYDADSGSAAVTTTSPSLNQATARVLLPTTNTVLAYGYSGGIPVNGAPAGAEVFSPRTATWARVASPSIDRYGPGLIALFDGSALAVGGEGPLPTRTSLASCEIYSPATNSWALTGPMSTARDDVVLAMLPSGNVLVAGGVVTNNTSIAEAEVFDVKARQWAAVGPMATPRQNHQMTTLQDGRVLVSAGSPQGFATPTSSCELFNPATSTFSPTGPMLLPRYLHQATLLPSGKVFVAGGLINNPLTPPTPPCYNTSVCFPLVTTNTTEVFDPATGAWTMGPSMPYNRAAHDQLLLPDGKVLITAGIGNQVFPNTGPPLDDQPSSLLYDAASNAFVATGSLPLTVFFQGNTAVLFRK